MTHYLNHNTTGRILGSAPPEAYFLESHPFSSMRAPLSFARPIGSYLLDMGGNDTAGDCAEAGYYNAVRVQANLAGWHPAIAPGAALTYYGKFGYVPGQSDPGTLLSALLADQTKNGVAGAMDGSPYVGLWSAVEPDNLNLLRCCIASFGLAYLGIRVLVGDTFQGVMDLGTGGDQTLEGGHCLMALQYTGIEDTDVVTLGTWGSPAPNQPLYQCTWRWLENRLEESYALVHPQLVDPSGLTGLGLNRDNLAADNQAFAMTT